jgi:hypothetical protein
VDALLQLRIDGSAASVVVGARDLPPFLDRLFVENLDVVGGRVDVSVRRTLHGLEIQNPVLAS